MKSKGTASRLASIETGAASKLPPLPPPLLLLLILCRGSVIRLPPRQSSDLPPARHGRCAIHDLGDEVPVDRVAAQSQCHFRTLSTLVLARHGGWAADADAVAADFAQRVVVGGRAVRAGLSEGGVGQVQGVPVAAVVGASVGSG